MRADRGAPSLRAIAHACDPEYQRLRLLMEEQLKGKVEANWVAKCELREAP